MANRYILIEGGSGLLFGEVNAVSIINAARALDFETCGHQADDYKVVRRAPRGGLSHYRIYDATGSELELDVTDGDAMKAVARLPLAGIVQPLFARGWPHLGEAAC